MSFQPCFQGAIAPRKLLHENASLKEVIGAMNGFYDEFLGKCLQDNLDFANQADINDGEFNVKNASKVFFRYTSTLSVIT